MFIYPWGGICNILISCSEGYIGPERRLREVGEVQRSVEKVREVLEKLGSGFL